MQVMYERCAGLDVHKKTVVACVLIPDGQVGWGQEIPHLWDDDGRFARALRLAAGVWVHACRHREHRRLLEAGVQHPGGHLRGVAGQCPARQGGARAQDGREGRGVAR